MNSDDILKLIEFGLQSPTKLMEYLEKLEHNLTNEHYYDFVTKIKALKMQHFASVTLCEIKTKNELTIEELIKENEFLKNKIETYKFCFALKKQNNENVQ